MTELDIGSRSPSRSYDTTMKRRRDHRLRQGWHYCAVLGPRLSGKTVLLRYVAQTLAQILGWTCIYIDLYDMRASTLQGFFADLIGSTASRNP